VLRLGLIGVGIVGLRYLDCIPLVDDLRLVGLLDVRQQHAQRIALERNTTAFRCARHLLSEVDSVIIATPTSSHYSYLTKCLSSRCAALVEKPLCASAAEARALLSLWPSTGPVVQVGHIERYRESFSVFQARCREMGVDRLSFYRQAGDSRRDAILDLMIHDIDMALTLAGQTDCRVTAYREAKSATGNVVEAFLELSFPGALTCHLYVNNVVRDRVRLVIGEYPGGLLRLDLLRNEVTQVTLDGSRTVVLYSNHQENALLNGLVKFAAALKGARPPVSLQDGAHAVIVSELCRGGAQ